MVISRVSDLNNKFLDEYENFAQFKKEISYDSISDADF